MAVVKTFQCQLGRDRADQRQEHIPLGIPGIALCAEERGCRFPCQESCPPFDQFVEGAEGQTDAGHEEKEPLAVYQRRAPQEDLARKDRGDEPLRGVTDAVVVVSGEPKGILYPRADGSSGIRVMATEHQNERVDEEESIEQGGQAKARIRDDQQGNAKQDRADLKQPTSRDHMDESQRWSGAQVPHTEGQQAHGYANSSIRSPRGIERLGEPTGVAGLMADQE